MQRGESRVKVGDCGVSAVDEHQCRSVVQSERVRLQPVACSLEAPAALLELLRLPLEALRDLVDGNIQAHVDEAKDVLLVLIDERPHLVQRVVFGLSKCSDLPRVRVADVEEGSHLPPSCAAEHLADAMARERERLAEESRARGHDTDARHEEGSEVAQHLRERDGLRGREELRVLHPAVALVLVAVVGHKRPEGERQK